MILKVIDNYTKEILTFDFINDFFNCLGLEKFVIQGYQKRSADITTISKLRWYLFSKHASDISYLPPTQAVLKYRIFRAHFIALVLKRCDQAVQDLPDATCYGWEESDNQLRPILSDELPAPVGLIELSMCSCKGVCDTNRCSCFKNKLTCTEMCQCTSECENDHGEEIDDDSTDIGSEDDDSEADY